MKLCCVWLCYLVFAFMLPRGFASELVKEQGISSHFGVPSYDPSPYFLPQNHHLKPILDEIFYSPKVLANKQSLAEAGFVVVCFRARNELYVVRHPQAKGYLFKVYLESEIKETLTQKYQRFVKRCVGAAAIRQVINEYKLHYFAVPDKWLYELPVSALNEEEKNQTRAMILVVQDMQLTTGDESKYAWRKKITKNHLQELYRILSRGYASLGLWHNIPYTRTKQFACIDTERSKRKYKLEFIKKYFSKKMKKEWDKILKKEAKNQ